MGVLLIVLILWVAFAAVVGVAFARLEQRINGLPEPRTKSAVLLSIFLGPIGWVITAARSSLKFASTFSENQRLQRDLARQQLDAAREVQGE